MYLLLEAPVKILEKLDPGEWDLADRPRRSRKAAGKLATG
jgi:hypothetical protein